MDFLIYLVLVFFISNNLEVVVGIRARYTTQLCPGSVGPSYGEVLYFDPDQEDEWVIPREDLDCYITLRGRPNLDGDPPRMITLDWRSPFRVDPYEFYDNTPVVDGNTTNSCPNAYIEVFAASDDGRIIEPPVIGPFCGTVAPTSYTSSSQALVVHVYVRAPPPELFTTVAPDNSTSGTEAVTAAVTVAQEVTVGGVTVGENVTTPDPRAENGGPYIEFTADFTSYFLGNCSDDGTANDAQQLECFTGRCIHRSLRCDIYFSDNCGDRGDIIADAPGFCRFDQDEDDDDDDDDIGLLPLWILLGILGLLAILYWCCWRPGWCPWRVCRLRNVMCGSRPCCDCCRACACCAACGICGLCAGPCSGCATKCCTRTESRHSPENKPTREGYRRLRPAGFCTCFECCRDKPGKYDVTPSMNGNAGGAWWNYAFDDGMHVREQR